MSKRQVNFQMEPIVHRRLKMLAAERGEPMGDTISYLLILRALVETGGFGGTVHRPDDDGHALEMERNHIAEVRDKLACFKSGGIPKRDP